MCCLTLDKLDFNFALNIIWYFDFCQEKTVLIELSYIFVIYAYRPACGITETVMILLATWSWHITSARCGSLRILSADHDSRRISSWSVMSFSEKLGRLLANSSHPGQTSARPAILVRLKSPQVHEPSLLPRKTLVIVDNILNKHFGWLFSTNTSTYPNLSINIVRAMKGSTKECPAVVST